MREHGTRARYIFGPQGSDRRNGCRCDDCRRAIREYEAHRTRMKAYGRWEPYVDAGPARAKVRELQELGLGWVRIARLAGISTGTMSKLLYGGPGDRPPSRRIRRETERRIFTVTWKQLADGAYVPAVATWERIETLLRAGYPKVRIAEALGQTRALQLGREQVTAGNARTIAALYDRLYCEDPLVRLAAEGEQFPRRIRDRHGAWRGARLDAGQVADLADRIERRRRNRTAKRRERALEGKEQNAP